MKHLLDIEQLSEAEIANLVARARAFKQEGRYPRFAEAHLALMFYENSTRTRVSFEMAAMHLGMRTIHLNPDTSSEAKGETIEDSIRSLHAMGINYFVIRHKQNGLPLILAETLDLDCHIINAGDGQRAHPSQALLDLMTILEKKPNLERLKIVILGDVLHSRVANSLQVLFKKMGLGELILVSPKAWQPKEPFYGRVTEALDEALEGADVIVCLRAQRERLLKSEELDLAAYQKNFMLTEARLKRARADAIIMHPGPVNHQVEIASELVHHQQSVILEQIKNGVFARMAILESLLLGK